MAINRVVALYIGMAAALAFAVFVLPTLICIWTAPYGITSMRDLNITDAQFEKDYLTVTVENLGTRSKIIEEVKVNQTSTPHIVSVHEPISAGEQISIRISFNWTSGYTYLIILETANESPAAQFVTVAP